MALAAKESAVFYDRFRDAALLQFLLLAFLSSLLLPILVAIP